MYQLFSEVIIFDNLIKSAKTEQESMTEKAFRQNVSKLNSTIEPKGRILDRLFEDEIIGNDKKFRIEQLPEREDRARSLMHFLFETGNPKALTVFKQVLSEISEYEWLEKSIAYNILKDDVRKHGDITHIYKSKCIPSNPIEKIEKKIRKIEFLYSEEPCLLFDLRESIYGTLRSEIQQNTTVFGFMPSGITLIKSLIEEILKQLDVYYVLGRLLGASWSDYESKKARFHCVNNITKLIASKDIQVTASVHLMVEALVDKVMSIAIADAKANCNSMRYSRSHDDINSDANGCINERNVKLYGVSKEQEHLRAQLVSNKKIFSKNLQTLEFWVNETSIPSLILLDSDKLEYWEPLMVRLGSVPQSIIDDVWKQLVDVYLLCYCISAAWNDYESSEAVFNFAHSIIQSIDDAGSPITESMRESMMTLVKEVMSMAIADAKADWNSTESPCRGQTEGNKGMKRKSNDEKGDTIKRRMSPSSTHSNCNN